MWKRIIAYIVCIPVALFGLSYGFSWYTTRQARLEGRKVLTEVASREDALDSLGDITLDPVNATLANLEQVLHQPSRTVQGARNSTRVGWACAGNDCEVWASFTQPLGTKLDPDALPAGFSIRDHVMRRRLHRISIGGVYLGEPVSEMIEYCKTRGYGTPVGSYHHITWDKNWSLVWGETGGKVWLLVFLNDKLLKAGQADATAHDPEVRP